jgi:hypothetical protein
VSDYFGAGMRLYLEKLVDWPSVITQKRPYVIT